MANTITRVQDSIDYWGKSLVVPVDYTFDGTVAYVNGTGFTLNAKDIGMRFFRALEIVGGSLVAGTYLVKFLTNTADAATASGNLPTSVNVRLFSAVGTELANGTYTTFTVRILAIGG